jgi:hypothetical protein
LIISNYTGYLHLLYLAFRFAPIFVLPSSSSAASSSTETCFVIQKTLIGAFLHLITSNSEEDGEKGESLTLVLQRAKEMSHGPVVLLAEGCTTNSTCVIDFAPSLKASFPNNLQCKIHVIAVRMIDSYAAFTTGSVFSHIAMLASSLSSRINVKTLNPVDLPAYPLEQPRASVEKWLDDVNELLATMMNLRRVRMNMKERADFNAYWLQQHSHQLVVDRNDLAAKKL